MVLNPNSTRLEYANISYTVTILPRLQYSNNLLNNVIHTLKNKRNEIKKSNLHLLELDENNHAYLKELDLERIIVFSLELLIRIQNRINSISGIHSIPNLLSSVISLIRTVSAQLFNLLPDCSQKLCELSVHLGSIVLDSAILTKARFDFSQSHMQSSLVLDKVKLMVDSKISKQYPNLNFFQVCNA
jgi:hypothetical protein